MAALFVHVNFRLTLWHYFWAWVSATAESAGPDLIKLSVPACFNSLHTVGTQNTMELVLCAPGCTESWLHVPLAAYERIYLLAGGTDATFMLPIFAAFAVPLKASSAVFQCMEFSVALPDSDALHPLPGVAATAAQLPNATVCVRVHYTHVESMKGNDSGIHVVCERPMLTDIVHEVHASVGKVVVIGALFLAPTCLASTDALTACWPDSFLYDVPIAEAQLVLADGFGTCRDLFLHTKTYRLKEHV
ncbi:hypothetical protein C8R44DRAFT_880069 [Mycena epipterygia]|nr:hypothetical protein C8R44DRAFT_880069 [Mycena epipterygia]